MRSFLAVLALWIGASLGSIQPAHAQLNGCQPGLCNPSGSIVFPGANLDVNCAQDWAWTASGGFTTPEALITVTHTGTQWEVDSAGNYHSFAANVLPRTDLGCWVWQASTNLFLNSQAPATQTITVVNAATYTASLVATSGSLTLSGACAGTVTPGNPVTCTTASTSLTVTANGPFTGDFVNAQVENVAFATSPIVTAGASATRGLDTLTVAGLSPGSTYSLVAWARPWSPIPGASQFQPAASLSDGTSSNRFTVRRLQSSGAASVSNVVGGTAQGASVLSGTWTQFTLSKIAMAGAASDQRAAFNGILGTHVTGSIGSALTELQFGFDPSSQQFEGAISRVGVFYSRISDAQLQAYTAP